MPADEADQLLVARIRQGHAEAWKELIARFEGRLHAFVFSRLRNEATTEDVVQDSLMGFLVSLPNYDERMPLESYLFSIAAHKLTDVLRREGRRPTIPLVGPQNSGGYFEPAGSARRASSLARSGERRVSEENVIADCLKVLIERWQTRGEFERLKCMELLFVMGLPNKQAAERIGITEQAVANHKHFVLSKLKDAVLSRVHTDDLSAFGLN